METRFEGKRLIRRTQPEIGVEWSRIYELSGIHSVLRIPDGFEVAKCCHEFRAEHAREQLTATLAVAMLARERTPVGDHEITGCLNEPTVPSYSIGGPEVKINPGVYASVPEVPVKPALIAKLRCQFPEVAHVSPEHIDRY
jgi:hypothetical protein